MPTTLSPTGTSPMGLGVPAEADAPPTGESQLCRFIHSGHRDYIVDSTTGHFQQMPNLRQRVLLILLQIFGSSTVLPDMGVDKPDKMGDGFKYITELRVREAFHQLTSIEKVMHIDDVVVTKLSTGRAEVLLVWTDLTTGIPDRTSTADLEALKWA